MCGIFGIKSFDPQYSISLKLVKDATDSMYHRGPDDSGYLVDKNIALGHRRLSIIDLSSGHQPMTNEDGNIVIVYNGEIYNFIAIREQLVSKGHIFNTDCDTEVIVHGYEEWGIDCLKKFNGMFSFILFDKVRHLLWIVRDRLGIKPLYYYHDKHVFIAASEVKALLKSGMVQSTINENVLDSYFSVGYVPGPETMFKGIKKVLPGHFLIVQKDTVKQYEYWDFAEKIQSSNDSENQMKRIDKLLLDCVSKRLISDVPVGAFLSGGLDSSIVVGLMNKIITSKSLNTFTVAYNQGYSEKEYAQFVADRFRTQHHVFYLEPENFLSSIETLVKYAEEPIVEPAAISLYHISRLASEHATVLLSGEGSDEVFGGYSLYQFMLKIEKARGYIPDSLLSTFPFIGSRLSKLKHKKYLDWMNTPLSARYQGTSSYLTPSLKEYLYHPDYLRYKSTYLDDQFKRYFMKVEGRDPLSQMLYVDTKTWLVDDLLVKADKMTMAASIELRVPFLDYRLIEAVSALGSDFKIKHGEGKYLLKKISEKIIPNKIIYRKKKGFPVPTKEWFSGQLMNQIGDSISDLKKEPWFNVKALQQIVSRHKTGAEDHSRLLMTLLIFSEWQHQYV